MATMLSHSIGKKSSYTGSEMAAIIMFSLPEEQAQKVFSSLEPSEIKNLSYAMTTLGNINSQEVEFLCSKFITEMSNSGPVIGSIDNTKRLLSKLMPQEDVDKIINEVHGPLGKNLWDKLSNVDEEMLAGYLKNESFQTVAVILSRIRPESSAKVLACLPEEMADDVVTRLLRMDTVRTEILEEIENTLHREFISTLGKSFKKDPYEMVAELFNNLDRTTETRLLSSLEKKKPEDAEKIRNLMFTFEDLGKLDKSNLLIILKTVDKSKLAIALKGTQNRIKEKFLLCMSERGAKLLLDEMNVLGLVRLKEVEKAQNEIVAIAKDMAARNEINIRSSIENNELLVE